MGKKKRLLLQYQPTAGVNSDFEQILQRFTATETVRFEAFAEIWREMKMSFIFAGRDSEKECREYTEEIMKMALKYVLPPYNFQVRVGGLYLLYGLFNQQPLIRKVRVRVTPEKWKEIVEFQKEARRQQHLDVNYVFHKLRFEDAFSFVATDSEVTFYLSTGGNTKEEDTAPDEFKEEQSVLYELFSDQFLEQLTQLHDHYHRVKVGLEGHNATEPSRSLNVIQSNIATSILGTVMAYQQRKQHHRKSGASDTEEESDGDDPDYVEMDGKNIKSHLKAKAYKNVAKANKSRRHRQAVESADESPEKSPTKGKRKKSLSETETISPPKKRKKKIDKRKKNIQMEEEITTKIEKPDTIDVENNESEPDVKKEEVIEREIIQTDILHMPSFDMEPSTSGTCTQESPPQNKQGRPKAKEKKITSNKKIKGKMPSVKLQPLVKKKKSPKTKTKAKTRTEMEDDT